MPAMPTAQYIKDNQPSWLFRIPNNHFALKAERNAILNSTLNLTLTDDDKATFIARYPEKESSFHTIGVFEYDEATENRISVEEGLKFVISGSMRIYKIRACMVIIFAPL